MLLLWSKNEVYTLSSMWEAAGVVLRVRQKWDGTLPGVDAHGIVSQEHESDHQSRRSGVGSFFRARQRIIFR